MALMVGSARHDENGKYTGGKKGDQLQKLTGKFTDLAGEVSEQPFYVHSKGWNVLRPISIDTANKLAEAMIVACSNKNIGYSQGCQRKTVDDLNTSIPINVDCSKTVRDCIYHATHNDVGNFTTANEVAVLKRSGLFLEVFPFKSLKQTPLYNGDVLVTKTKGHTVIVTSGNARIKLVQYFPKYNGTSSSIVTALKTIGVSDTSLAYRKKIASVNKVTNYSGTAPQNTQLLKLLKSGKLIKP